MTGAVRKSSWTIEKLVSVFSVVISAIALYFSWQANQIASKQITDHVISPSISYTWAMYMTEASRPPTYHSFVCDQRIRLSNVGGAGTSIVRYTAILSYRDITVEVSGEQDYALTTGSNDIFSSFKIDFINDYRQQNSTERLFPIDLPPYSTTDIWTRASFIIQKYLTSGDYFYPPYDFYQFLQPGAEYGGLYPVEISYTFTTASNKRVSTSTALCIFLK
ncbi:MAG: hypothetical protein QXS54_07900 [Candidatus Methanomethylicaceae archaeon]